MFWLLSALLQAVAPATPSPAATAAALDPRWAVALPAAPAQSAGYDRTTAYIATRDGLLVAIDLERGAVRWQRAVADATVPDASGGLVFVGSRETVLALDAASGQPRWQRTLPGVLSSVHFDTGWLLCAGSDGTLYALRADDGTAIWNAALGSRAAVAPAAGLDKVYVGLEDGRLVALTLADGRVVWTRPMGHRITGVSAVAGQLVVGTGGAATRAVYSFDLERGDQRWRWRVGGDVSGPASSDDRFIFVASRDNVLRALDVRTGTLRWSADLPARPLGGPVLVGGTVRVPLAATVALFESATGKAVGTVEASGDLNEPPRSREARPAGASLVTITRDGRVLGFGRRIEPPLGPLTELPGGRARP